MDITHHTIEKGSGKIPFMLLHGNNEDSTYFSHQIEYFSQTRRVIAIDTRGHGKTPRGSAPFTIRQFADDLYCFFDERNIRKADILGFSDGANIAMCFAAKYPGRVHKLVLNGGNLTDSGIRFKDQFPVEIGYRFAKLCGYWNQTAKQKSEMLGLMCGQPNISAAELHKINAPALVIAGTHDVIKRKHTEYIAAQIRGAQLSFISGGHYVAAENPDEFNKKVAKFLSDNCT